MAGTDPRVELETRRALKSAIDSGNKRAELEARRSLSKVAAPVADWDRTNSEVGREAVGVVGKGFATVGKVAGDVVDLGATALQTAAHNMTSSEDEQALQRAQSTKTLGTYETETGRSQNPEDYVERAVDAKPEVWSPTQDTGLGQSIHDAPQHWDEMKSPTTKAQEAEVFGAGDGQQSEILAAWDTLKALKARPLVAGELIVENLGLMVPTAVSSRIAALPAARQAFEQTLKKETERLIAGHVPREAAEQAARKTAIKVARNAGIRAGAAAGMWTEAAMGAAFSGDEAAQSILLMDDEVIQKSGAYQEMIGQGLSDRAARQRLAQEAKLLAAPLAGASTAVIGRLSGALGREAEIFSGLGMTTQGVLGGVMRFGETVAKEALQEVGQETGEQVASNVGRLSALDQEVTLADATKGAGSAAAIGGIAGAGMGAAAGGAEALGAFRTAESSPAEPNTVQNNSADTARQQQAIGPGGDSAPAQNDVSTPTPTDPMEAVAGAVSDASIGVGAANNDPKPNGGQSNRQISPDLVQDDISEAFSRIDDDNKDDSEAGGGTAAAGTDTNGGGGADSAVLGRELDPAGVDGSGTPHPGDGQVRALHREAGEPDASLAIAANEAATSPANDLPEPTEAQKEAGNYRKGHIKVHGLDISIENPAGSRRKPEWEPLQDHYGYIRGSKGADKEHVDVFVGPSPDSDTAYIIDQIDPETGKFDEHKVILGATSEEDARQIYARNYQSDWQGLAAVTAKPIADLKNWLASPQARPANPEATRAAASTPKPKVKKAPKPATTAAELGEQQRRRLLQIIKRGGGITQTEGRDIAGEAGRGLSRLMPGLFRKTGRGIDEIATVLHEAGFISDADYQTVDGGAERARELIDKAIRGQAVLSADAVDEYNRMKADEHYGAEEVRAELILDDDQVSDLLSEGLSADDKADILDHDLLARIAEHDEVAFERAAMQFENDDAGLMAWAQEYASEQGTAATGTQQGSAADRGDAQDGGAPQGRDDASATGEPEQAGRELGRFDLESQSEEELAARAQQQADQEAAGRAEERRSAEKAQADKDRDNFALTGSSRPADVAMAGGQRDLLGAAPSAVASTKSAPASEISAGASTKPTEAVTKSAEAVTVSAEPVLSVEPFGKQLIIVRGDTKPNKDRIKAIGGAMWRKDENGWAFKASKEAAVREALADLLAPSDQITQGGKAGATLESGTPETNDAQPARGGVERYSEDAAVAKPVRSEVVSDGPGRADSRARADGESAGTAGERSGGRAGVSGTGAAAGRAGRDTGVSEGAPDTSGSAAGAAGSQRSAADGDRATKPDHVPARTVEAAARKSVNLEEKIRLQKEAESVPVKLGARVNIADTLPLLLTSQHDDVEFAERRFADPEAEPGVLFTNGTGTGKTYTGLGVAKRFQRRGKDNILILVPNDKIASDWAKSAANLQLDVKRLESTKDNGGSGPVITTYANAGDNLTLADRDWDLILPDEAHYLGSGKNGDITGAGETLRAITRHKNGGVRRAQMKHRALYGELEPLKARAEELQTASTSPSASHSARAAARVELESVKKQVSAIMSKIKDAQAVDAKTAPKERTKVAFMSASPFAYDKSVDWAEGYLFDYPAEEGKGGYNEATGRNKFMVQHFGYSMKYGRLTQPNVDVDRGLMEVEFNQWLRDKGALSTRQLDSEHDYDREFVLVDDAIGGKVDQGFEFLKNAYGGIFEPLHSLMKETFDYQAQMYLLEALKAKHAGPIIKDYLKRGRKVVVFHGFNKGGSKHPFHFSEMSSDRTLEIPVRKEPGDGDAALRLSKAQLLKYKATMLPPTGNYYSATLQINLDDLIKLFESLRPDLKDLDMGDMLSPIERFKSEFPDARFVNGTVSQKTRRNAVDWFNADDTGPAVLVVQSDAGREGISMHDTSGAHRRVIVNLGLPVRPVAAIQEEGRIYRVGQASDAVMRYMNTGTAWERNAFAQKIATRAGTVENMAMGAEARSLKESFIDAFESSAPYQGRDDDGKGGKAKDRASRRSLTAFERAKTHYFAQQKKTSRTKAAEGVDYFATPEPIGYKMVEWANVGAGDSILEPSAGHGAIARYFPESAKRRLIEPSSELSSRASLVAGGAEIVASRFEEHNTINKYDAVVMNPPFGHGGKTAMDHVSKAIEHLRDNGRVVALIPEGPAADKQWAKLLEAHEDIHVAATISLPTVAFERAGTAVKSKIVVIDKVAMTRSWDAATRKTVYRQPEGLKTANVDLSREESVKDLFDRLENVDVPRRAGTPERVAEQPRKRPNIQAAVRTRGGISAAPLTAAAARAIAAEKIGDNAIAGLEQKGILRFVENIDALPSSALQDYVYSFDSQNPGRRVVAVTDQATGRIFFIADRLRAGDVAPLIVHELGEHYSLPRMIGTSRYKQLMGEIRGMRESDIVGKAWGEVAKLRPDLDQSGDEFASEVLAHLSETEAFRAQPLWKRLLSWVRQFLFRIGFTRAWKLKDEDLAGMVVAALRRSARDGSLKAASTPAMQAGVDRTPVFYSQLAAIVAEKLPKKGGARIFKSSIEAWQRKGEFKKEELEWSGLLEWLDTQGTSLTRDDVVEYLRANAVEIDEVELGGGAPDDYVADYEEITRRRDMGGQISHHRWRQLIKDLNEKHGFEPDASPETARPTKFSLYQVPGGKQYRELLLTLPAMREVDERRSEELDVEATRLERAGDIAGMQRASRERGDLLSRTAPFRSSHFEQPNILAHVRFNERTDPEGKKVLFVEEVQSDWHQKGRKDGYLNRDGKIDDAGAREFFGISEQTWDALSVADREAYIDEANSDRSHVRRDRKNMVPDAPMKKSWPLTAMKRMIRYAAENGFDSIAWTVGTTQAKRYDLSTQVSSIAATQNDDGTYTIITESTDGRVVDSMTVAKERLPDVVGKDLAERIVKDEGGQYSGVDLHVGGESLRAFYDRELVNETKRYIKKWGATVTEGKVSAGTIEPSIADAILNRSERRPTEAMTESAHVITLTSEMREAALQPQPLFAVRETKEQQIEDDAWRKAGMAREHRTLAERTQNWAAQRMAKVKTEFMDSFQTGMFDRFKPIKDAEGAIDPSRSGYVSARFSTGASSVLYASLLYGSPQLRDGVIQKKDGSKGLFEILKPVGGDLNRWAGWMVGKRAETLAAQGKENNLTLAEIEYFKGLAGDNLEVYEKVAKDVRGFMTDILEVMRASGLLSADQVEAFSKDAYYLPFYRVEDEAVGGDRRFDPASVVRHFTKRGLSHQSSGIKQLKGGTAALNDPIENLFAHITHALDASMKNYALARTIPNIGRHVTYAKEADRAKAIRVMWSGKPYWINVDEPALLRALTAVGEKPREGAAMDLGRSMRRLLTTGVTLDPAFMLRNFARDSMHSWIIDKNAMKLGIDSLRGAKATLQSLRAEAAGNPEEADAAVVSMMFAGASFVGGHVYGTDPKANAAALRKALRRRGYSKEKADSYMDSLVSTGAQFASRYMEIGEAIENANRAAVFKASQESGADLVTSLYDSKDLMDFSLRGQWATIQVMADVLPFFNARLQGLYKLGREAGRDPKLLGLVATRIAARGALMAMASIALAAAYAGDDRYEELEEWDKDANWHFWVNGVHYRIPKPFELGIVFGTIPERMYRLAIGNDKYGETLQSLWHGVVSTLAINPVPQAIRPAAEVFFNFDMFRMRPIESMADQAKMSELRFGTHTSPIMTGIGSVTGMSPKKLEYLWNGYLGTVGSYALGAADTLVRIARGDVTPTKRIEDYPIVGSFARTGPAWSTEYSTELYQTLGEAEQAWRSIKALRQEGREDLAAQIEDEKRELLEVRKMLDKTASTMSKMRKQRDQVYRSDELSADQKREQLDKIQLDINEASKGAMKAVEEAGVD